jgi:hypothetical protein
VPLAGAAVLLLLTAYLLITVALAAAIAAAFASSPYRWFFGFGIVGVVWALLGAVAGYFAKRELELKTLAPKRTIEVLKGDKVWLQKEVNTLTTVGFYTVREAHSAEDTSITT